jgi:hypothetical protein
MPPGEHLKGKKCPGSGRKPGVTNKQTKALKDMILGALSDVGGQAYLARQAEENPGPFLALVGKVLPTTLTTDANGPVIVEIRRTIIDPAASDG